MYGINFSYDDWKLTAPEDDLFYRSRYADEEDEEYEDDEE